VESSEGGKAMVMLLNLLLILQFILLANGSFTQEFTYENVTNNLGEWDKDLVIMFYAPWCKFFYETSFLLIVYLLKYICLNR